MAAPVTLREKLIREMRIALGGTIVDVELEQEEYDYCIDITLDRYRQRSGNSLQEGFLFLEIQPDVATYTLPKEVQDVIAVYRRSNGSSGGTIDPFSLSFTQNVYMIQNPGAMGGSGAGQLATYDFAMQYQNLVGRMFGRDIQYTWNPTTKKIMFHRRFQGDEEVGLHIYNERPEEIMLADVYSKPWIRSMAIANAKMLMGQARSKFSTLAGPQGGITLNGDALKNEAQAEMDKLEEELKNLVDQNQGYGFVIG